MIVAGLTGSIGMGKSTTAQMFRDEGIPVYDADATVHALYENEAVSLIEAEFPGTTNEGGVDRRLLGEQVIGKPDRLKTLEAIIHPLVREKEIKFRELQKQAGAELIILDIPLLFETGGDIRVDKIIVVSCSPEEQRRRVLSRDEMTEEKFLAILNKQSPDAEKRAKADFVIDTGSGLNVAREQVREIIAQIGAAQ